MSDFFDTEPIEPIVDTTLNIEFQLNKFTEGEYLKEKHIPEKALFAKAETLQTFKNFYINDIDMPILVSGAPGIGKLTSIIAMLPIVPSYLPDYENDNKINNLEYFKVLDAEYNKVLAYENIFYLNIKVLNNQTDIANYLKYIYSIAKARSITDEKKIIIINHIDRCNYDSQRYIAFMLDKITTGVAYIFTTYTTNKIDRKITSSCASINFKYLDEETFTTVFKHNYKNHFARKDLMPAILKQYYQIYITNRYNIGNTISQIKYHLSTTGNAFLKDKTNTCSLLSRIASNFIKKRLVLSTVNSALDIRKFLYTLLSLNFELIIFIEEVVKQLVKSKLNDNIKNIILQKAGTLSAELSNVNKEIIIVETFFYDIINVIYSGGVSEKNISKK